MRPEISGILEERINRLYKEAGYGTASELVRDAVRSHLTELEANISQDESSQRQLFTYQIFTAQNHPPEIRLSPKRDSRLEVEEFEKGSPPYTVLFDTGTSYVGGDEIESALETIEGIRECSVPYTTGEIHVYVAESNAKPLKDLIDDIYYYLTWIINIANQEVKTGNMTRQEAYQQAVKPYWEELTGD